jgi:hypothetical protein
VKDVALSEETEIRSIWQHSAILKLQLLIAAVSTDLGIDDR